MNTEQAKFILQSMRPEGQDRDDPNFREALEVSQAVPELQTWMEAEQNFDRQFSAALQSVEPPAALKSRILAGARASSPTTRSWWQSGAARSLIAVAAVVTLAFVLLADRTGSPLGEGPALASYRSTMLDKFENMAGLGYMGPDHEEVRAWLASHEGSAQVSLPPALSRSDTIGCQVLDWEGRRVSVICFKPSESNPGQVKPAHLFVVDQSEVPELISETGSSPLFASVGDWQTAAWRQEDEVYMLITKNEPEVLSRMLEEGVITL